MLHRMPFALALILSLYETELPEALHELSGYWVSAGVD